MRESYLLFFVGMGGYTFDRLVDLALPVIDKTGSALGCTDGSLNILEAVDKVTKAQRQFVLAIHEKRGHHRGFC